MINDIDIINSIIEQAEKWFDKNEQKSDGREKPERCLKLIIDNDTVKDVITQAAAVLDERKQQADSVQETKPADNEQNNNASSAPINISMADKQKQSNNAIKKPAARREKSKAAAAGTPKTGKSSKTDSKKSSKK